MIYDWQHLVGFTDPAQGRRSLFRAHRVRAARLIVPMVVVWSVVALICSRLSGIRAGDYVAFDFVGALVCGLVMGTAMSWFETRPLRPGFINRFPWLDIVMRAALYTGALIITMILGRALLFGIFPEELPGERWRPFSYMVQNVRYRRFVILMFIATFALNFLLHLRLAIGPRHLSAMFLGRYRLPVREQRLFLFIDLVNSTAIAERLGPLQFTHFKHDFFCELSSPLSSSRGTIVQYVGDEVMLTWQIDALSETVCPLQFLDDLRKRLKDNATYYLNRYETVPEFRAGIHAGEVVVAEVGDTRRDIVYSGDTVNAAARLLQACRPQSCTLLISESAAEVLHSSFRENLLPHQALSLRGRKHPLPVLREP